ncbi:MAG TPA: BrnT family toxin [Thermoguttaceae bacterium]
MTLQCIWDENKARLNLRKHRVSFEEASTVFIDPLACIFDDEDHSQEEHREILIGYSVIDHLLIVSFTELEDNHIRIISARRATKKEHKAYEEDREIS